MIEDCLLAMGSDRRGNCRHRQAPFGREAGSPSARQSVSAAGAQAVKGGPRGPARSARRPLTASTKGASWGRAEERRDIRFLGFSPGSWRVLKTRAYSLTVLECLRDIEDAQRWPPGLNEFE